MRKIKVTTSRVFSAIKRAQTRVLVNEGSSRSTKTFSILQYIIGEHLTHPGTRTTIARARLTWLKATVFVDFKEIMRDHFGLWNEDDMHYSDMVYHLMGGEIAFIGLDEYQKIHGRKQDMFWINEAIEADLKDFQQLMLRTTRKAILDYNPSREQHWIYDKVITRDDCTFIKSTYKDNPFLSPDIVQEIERLEPTPYNIAQGTADEVSWKIYGLGERAAHKGLIFGTAKICKELPPLEEWRRDFRGLDFGFTNDPTALVHVVLAHGELWLDQEIYKRGLTNIKNPLNPGQSSIQEYLEELKVPKSRKIWADAAEPKSIQDLVGCGYVVLRADKGADSVVNGIATMQKYKINITERSIDGIKEKNNYKWKVNKSGEALNEPIDSWNHFWDAARYACFMELRNNIPVMSPISMTGPSKWLNR